MRFMRKNQRKPAGFNLIEVLIATVIIGVGFMAMASLQATSISGNSRSSYLTEATYLAQDLIEQFRNTTYINISTAGSPQANITEQGNAGGIFTRSWTVVNDSPGIMMKTITVTITWQERGMNNNLVMTSVIIG
ncbi:MAG: prepilin-type N-terminal cleavage/methylation domain-containing protein [Deltaproteobacteria bacterium]|nr:prepilin-type N-terminal cleavage/methylation domain-containing protein [Deltaproteobacteria bacterium]